MDFLKKLISDGGGFTLIEILVTFSLVSVLSGVVLLALNPVELIKKAHDTRRLDDLAYLDRALGILRSDQSSLWFGSSSVVYVSLPDTTSTCANLGLPTLASGWSYNCVTNSNLKKSDGNGWLPVNFTEFSAGGLVPALPVDPVNSASSSLYYTYVFGSWELTAKMESAAYGNGGSKDVVSTDGGTSSNRFETGNKLTVTPVDLENEVAASNGYSVGGLSYGYRKSFTITNGSSSQTNYRVSSTVDTASLVSSGKMNSDCSDIRFAASDGSTELDYWVESGCNTSATKIWVKVPTLSNGSNTVYMNYGNASAPSSSTPWNLKVYVLVDGTTECSSRMKPFIDATGFATATCGVNEYSYSGTATVDLSSYDVILLLDGASYGQTMPSAGQTRLYTEVNDNGKGLVVFEWAAYQGYDSRWRILNRSGGFETVETKTVSASHPVTEGVASSWSASRCGSNIGTTASTLLVTGSTSNHAVVTKNLGSGRVVEFGIAPGYQFSGYNCWDSNTQKLLTNTIKWLGRPYVSPEPTVVVGTEE